MRGVVHLRTSARAQGFWSDLPVLGATVSSSGERFTLLDLADDQDNSDEEVLHALFASSESWIHGPSNTDSAFAEATKITNSSYREERTVLDRAGVAEDTVIFATIPIDRYLHGPVPPGPVADR